MVDKRRAAAPTMSESVLVILLQGVELKLPKGGKLSYSPGFASVDPGLAKQWVDEGVAVMAKTDSKGKIIHGEEEVSAAPAPSTAPAATEESK